MVFKHCIEDPFLLMLRLKNEHHYWLKIPNNIRSSQCLKITHKVLFYKKKCKIQRAEKRKQTAENVNKQLSKYKQTAIKT